MTKTINCPHCGRPLSLVASGRRRGLKQSRQTATFQHAQQIAPGVTMAPDGADWKSETPIDRLNTHDVKTALADSGVVSFIAGILSWGVVVWMGGHVRIEGQVYYIWPLIPTCAALAFCARYFDGIKTAKSLLAVVETIKWPKIKEAHDPSPEPQIVKVEVQENKRWQFAYLNVEPAKLRALARDALGDQGFTERTAIQVGFTQDEFRRLREEFLSRKWVLWKHQTRKQQGVEISRFGKLILQGILDTPLPHQPQSPADHALGSTRQHAARNSDGNYEFVE